MTVYVDNYRVPARVGRLHARWSHLVADSPAELHEFAARLGLRRDWYQERCKLSLCDPCPHWHYDVTDSMRTAAIEAGARPVGIREMGTMITARRSATAATGEAGDGT